ncbi:PadR family transcriptional regulator [Streptomyces collinus]|uniref:PadR family transcriptional regulator n=1 Tax=Streptomyces collinus TaxID=42684 RepID=UPI0033EC96D9
MREFQRGAARLHILHHAAEEETHGAWMTEELASHGYQISPGKPAAPAGGRRPADLGAAGCRRPHPTRYKATEAGKRALAEDRRALAELAREVLGDDAP